MHHELLKSTYNKCHRSIQRFIPHTAFIFNLDILTRISLHEATMATSHATSSHIEAKIIPLALLTQQSRRWSSKVLLVEKSHRHKTKLPGKEFQRYIFIDEAGTQIQAMSYTLDTTIVDTILQPLGTYIISNAKIVPCNM